MQIDDLKSLSQKFRIQMLEMFRNAGGGHFGGSYSVIDILTVLYFGGILKVDPKNEKWKERDRLVLSKGHASGALCVCLAEKQYFSKDLLATFNDFGSPFGMHPDMTKICGCDMSTGSLGHGLSAAVGMAMAAKLDDNPCRVFAILGDTEMHSGMTYEAIMAAGNFQLENLIMILDRNRISLDGETEKIMPLEPLNDKLHAFKWDTLEVDGHDHSALVDAFKSIPRNKDKPTAVIANTIKGKGVSFMENTHKWHYGMLDETLYSAAIQELKRSTEVG